MDKPKFVYVIYIATTREKLWEALTSPDWTRQYWANCWQDSSWEQGASWKLMAGNGRLGDDGEILEIDPPSRLVVSWRNHLREDLNAIGFTRMSYDLEETPLGVKVTVTHETPAGGEAFLDAVSQGWPAIFSSLKSLLETGKILPTTDKWPEGC